VPDDEVSVSVESIEDEAGMPALKESSKKSAGSRYYEDKEEASPEKIDLVFKEEHKKPAGSADASDSGDESSGSSEDPSQRNSSYVSGTLSSARESAF